jgi:hypothetical protein
MNQSSLLVPYSTFQDTHNQKQRTPEEEVAYLRTLYGSLFDRLLFILHHADLIGIAQFGFDAHEMEVMKLLQTLPKLRSAQEVCEFLQRILTESWAPDGFPIKKPEQLPVVAKDIWRAWTRYKHTHRFRSRAGKLLVAHHESAMTCL